MLITVRIAVFAIIAFALFLHYPENNFHSTPSFILSKLYTISLVTSLNARLRIVNGRDGDDADIGISTPGDSLRFVSFVGDVPDLRTRQREQGILVDSSRTVGSVVNVNLESNTSEVCPLRYVCITN